MPAPEVIQKLVEKFLTDRQIDRLVYLLYELTYGKIALVEQSV